MAAIAAVDVATWDLKAKAGGMPHQPLGRASRTGLLTCHHASGKTTDELLDSIREHQEQGCTAIRVQKGVHGLKSIHGIASHSTFETNAGTRDDHEPGQQGTRPAEENREAPRLVSQHRTLRWPSARSSTRSGTTRRSSASRSSTTSAWSTGVSGRGREE